jgi:hypothetical protein
VNLCGKNKKRLWPALKAKHPDLADRILETVQAFPGEYKMIDVGKHENSKNSNIPNLWEGCGLKIK